MPESGREGIKATVYNLNAEITVVRDITKPLGSPHRVRDFREMRRELRRLVRNWQASGPNLKKMFEKDPELEKRCMHGRTLLVPTRTGRGYLSWLPNPLNYQPFSQRDTALTHFMSLIVDPEWELLGGPCPRCDNYFLKKAHRKQISCSRKCGAATTAVETRRKKLRELYEEKLRTAEEAIAAWKGSRTRQDWKIWVANETGLSLNWLTHAVNQEKLLPGVRNTA
jgi:hypothetical protein